MKIGKEKSESVVCKPIMVGSRKNVFGYRGRTYIYESGLGRIQQHSENGFFTVSASRDEGLDDVNNKNYIELKRLIRGKGLGYITLLGGGSEVEKGKDGEYHPVLENSLFVPYMPDVMSEVEFLNLVKTLALKFGQTSFIIKSMSDQKILLYMRDDLDSPKFPDVIDLGVFRVNDVEEQLKTAFSKLKNGSSNQKNIKYVFAGYRIPQNSIESRALYEMGEILR